MEIQHSVLAGISQGFIEIILCIGEDLQTFLSELQFPLIVSGVRPVTSFHHSVLRLQEAET